MMIEFVLWSFVVAALPMVVDLSVRALTATAEVFWWTSDRMVKHARNGCHTIHRPAPFGPLGAVKHGR